MQLVRMQAHGARRWSERCRASDFRYLWRAEWIDDEQQERSSSTNKVYDEHVQYVCARIIRTHLGGGGLAFREARITVRLDFSLSRAQTTMR